MFYSCKKKLFKKLKFKNTFKVTGGLILSALFESFAGMFGLVGLLTRLIGPITIANCIAMIGLDLVYVVPNHAKYSWLMTVL